MRKTATVIVLLVAVLGSSLSAQATVATRAVSPAGDFDVGILRVERFGPASGRPIVLIPALFCGSWQWNAQINALAARYDAFAVTLPGFDGRPMIAGNDLMPRAAESLHRLIAKYRMERPIVIGHSLGGTIAVYFGEHYPNDAGAIVTVEGGYPQAPTQAQRDAAVAKSIAPYKTATPGTVGAIIKKTTLQYTITNPDDVATVEKRAARSDPAAVVAWMRAALLLDLTPGLAKITVPFTVIIPFDPVIDPYQGFKTEEEKLEAYTAWARHARHGRVIVITPSRHFVMFDQPAKFEDAIESAISS